MYYVCAKSYIGKIRKKNEDNFYCEGVYRKDLSINNFKITQNYSDDKIHIFAVFDGIGGLHHGEEASYLAAHKLDKYVRELQEKNKEFNALDMIRVLNQYICENMNDLRMGCTIASCVCFENKIQIINIGDSRAYLYRNGSLKQMSFDHNEENSFKRMQETLGLKDVCPNRIYGNTLTQYLGVNEDEFILEPEINEIDEFKDEDIVLLCSDGLTNMISDAVIKNILDEDLELNLQRDKLINKALENGGLDNITVLLISRRV